MKGKVLLIGLGLIGGSLALAMRRSHKDIIIMGYDVNKEQCRLAKKLQVIDEECVTIEDGAKEADLVIIATPVNITPSIIATLANCTLKENVIVTDVGSTKQKIVKASTILRENGITFIGGHPMAGSHKSGVIAAKERLFENAFYLLTPTDGIPMEKVEQLKEWLAGTNAKFLHISPKEHDYITGVISHFPHIIAASLVHQAEQANNGKNLVNRLAAGGFRDITRIASSSPDMWRDILLHNKDVMLRLLSEWRQEMERVEQLLHEENETGIYDYFFQAKETRDQLPTNKKGAIHSFYDLFVDVPDYPGVISEITGYLAIEDISITNIRILETREDIYGVLVISFQTDDDRKRAVHCIEHYTDYMTSFGP
ncbi:prephenate dehydrogenase [Cerasibacillus terrae]|uniref:Prephenate dehydrogenase n=1 Tax=Cerasibacillus terrae TaxID=2498845 RepID=A0A5C8NI59_9BACI|nr:prephenate dehydrogenase [Cerasibacillus terrae]TXL57856.1 prephenate dehydrogenase [Cerasibacillus terrae]